MLDLLELLDGKALVRCSRFDSPDGIEIQWLFSAASLEASFSAQFPDDDSPHRLCGHGVEMSAVAPF